MSEELNLDKKVEIKNLCDWDLYFGRIETNGSVRIPRNGKIRISRAEIQAQVYDNNKMFVGMDGSGSHARIYVDDKDTRILLDFEQAGSQGVQQVLDSAKVEKLLGYKQQKTFEDKVSDLVKTQAEKNFLAEEAMRQKLNNYDKIQFIEDYTGYKFNK